MIFHPLKVTSSLLSFTCLCLFSPSDMVFNKRSPRSEAPIFQQLHLRRVTSKGLKNQWIIRMGRLLFLAWYLSCERAENRLNFLKRNECYYNCVCCVMHSKHRFISMHTYACICEYNLNYRTLISPKTTESIMRRQHSNHVGKHSRHLIG